MGDLHIELHPVPVELVVVRVQQIMALLLEIFNDVFEFGSQTLHSF